MEAPSALHLACPNCGRTPHRVVRGRVSRGREIVFEGTVRCLRCGYTRKETHREWAARTVPLIVSDRDASQRSELELSPQETVRVGDRLPTERGMVEITAIEVDARRAQEARVEDVDALWSKRADRVEVKFSLNKGRKTLSYTLEVPPEEEFVVGSLVELGREEAVIHRMKTSRGLLRRGGARAEEIQRAYCKAVRRRSRGRGGGRSR